MEELLKALIVLVFLPPTLLSRWLLLQLARASGEPLARKVCGAMLLFSILTVVGWIGIENASSFDRAPRLRSTMTWVGLCGLLLFAVSAVNLVKFPQIRDELTIRKRKKSKKSLARSKRHPRPGSSLNEPD